MIDRLKSECGDTFTKKCEEIFKDLEISRQLDKGINWFTLQEFQSFLEKNSCEMNESEC